MSALSQRSAFPQKPVRSNRARRSESAQQSECSRSPFELFPATEIESCGSRAEKQTGEQSGDQFALPLSRPAGRNDPRKSEGQAACSEPE
jgi:hypothetical protein